MSWSSRRKMLIVVTASFVLLALAAVTAIAVVYETPSCMDGTQNQGEAGVDCGGSCRYLCAAQVQQPTIRFVRQFASGEGRTDVIAYVINPNPSAAVAAAEYAITLYDDAGAVVGEREGAIGLPPSSTVPIFEPGFQTGSRTPVRAFLAFDPSSLNFETYDAETPRLSVIDVAFAEGETPRITANVRNRGALPVYGLPVVATVFDSENNALAASATVIDAAPGASVPVVFTWKVPFSGEPARTEVVPRIPLQAP